MKFGGHQSFHLRDQWLYKGLSRVSCDPQILVNSQKNTLKAMRELGVGKNMADSIRYWLKAACLIKESSQGYVLTSPAHTIFKKDPYFELDGTLFLVHYLLVTNKETAPAWHWFFNNFSANEFDKESLTNSFYAYIQIKTNKKIKPATLDKDLTCLLRMYQEADYHGRSTPETDTPSPFTKYGWIKKQGAGFVRNKLNVNDFNIHVFSYLLYMFWKNYLAGSKAVSLEDLSLKQNSPGRIFYFSLEEMAELTEASAQKGYLDCSRTGGYFIVRPHQAKLKNALNNYYSSMNVQHSNRTQAV